MTSTGKSLSLRANFSWTFVGNIVYAASQWGILTVLAKLGTPESVGQFAQGLAITAPVIMFTNFQLRGIQATDARQQFAFGDYLALRLIGMLVALAVIVSIVSVGAYQTDTALVILMIGLSKICESLSDVFYGLLQRHEQMDRIAKSMILKGLLSLAALSLGVYFTGSVFWGTVGLTIVWAVLLVFYDIPSSRLAIRSAPFHPIWNMRRLLNLAWLALPLALVTMLLSINTNVPRYAIQYYYGTYELGIFAALSYLIVAGTTVVSALGQSASPRLAKYYAQGNSEAFRSLLLKLVGIGAIVGSVGVIITLIAGRWVLTVLYSAEYAYYENELLWIVIAASVSFITSFLGYGMTAARYFRSQLPLFLTVVLTNVLCSVWLIPDHGLYGAAYALLISGCVQLAGTCFVIFTALRSVRLN